LCGRNAEAVQLASPLPVNATPCSCNACRYSTGMLYFSCLPISSQPSTVGHLTEYNSSSKLSRYFCPTCGSHMFVHVAKDDAWSVCSGVIDRVIDHEHAADLSLEKILQHEFVGDSRDGGVAVCLGKIDGRPVPLLSEGPGEGSFQEMSSLPSGSRGHREPSGPTTESIGSTDALKDADELRGGCHCGGVAFRVSRPNVVAACSSPWPDLLVPYHSSSSENRQDVKWWLRAGGSKYLAGLCACRSCRLGSGSPIQAWAFVPKSNIFQVTGEGLTYEMGTLTRVESSTDCYREFCRTCGATVFWHCRERPAVVDVSVGLLRAEEGSRAETWLHWWTDRVSFAEAALDQALIRNLERGLQAIKVTE